MFYVYILKSLKSSRYYKGQTNDLKSRIERHNKGLEKFTSKELPWELFYYVTTATRSEAMKLEKKLKNLKSTQRLVLWVENEIKNGRGSRKVE
jgi:putative endonuclease